uniref:Uncharacterized protein n=1 Tax=Ananas comosus var. bracteatus TaxID=296719 RepID=A0A6V7NHT8_ANACO|nr:unnamed protein product [Ananas comosus var. bracteatus]
MGSGSELKTIHNPIHLKVGFGSSLNWTLDLDLGKEIRTLKLLLGFQTFKSVLQEQIRTFSVTHWTFANCEVRVFELVPTYDSHLENRGLKLSTKISKVKILGCSRVGLCRAEYRYCIDLVTELEVLPVQHRAGIDCSLAVFEGFLCNCSNTLYIPTPFGWGFWCYNKEGGEVGSLSISFGFFPLYASILMVYSPLLLSFGILGTFPPWEKALSLKKSLLEERSSTLAHSKP